MRFQAPAIALQVKHGRSPQAAQSIPTYGACLIPFSCIALPPLALVIARDPETNPSPHFERQRAVSKWQCRDRRSWSMGRPQQCSGEVQQVLVGARESLWADGEKSQRRVQGLLCGESPACSENPRVDLLPLAPTFSRRMSLPGRFGSARTRLQSSNDCAGSTFGLTRKVSAEPCTAQARSRPLRQRGA